MQSTIALTEYGYNDSSELFNDLVVEAVEQEVRQCRFWSAHQRIIACCEIVENRTGIQTNSVDLIRNLREGKERCT